MCPESHPKLNEYLSAFRLIVCPSLEKLLLHVTINPLEKGIKLPPSSSILHTLHSVSQAPAQHYKSQPFPYLYLWITVYLAPCCCQWPLACQSHLLQDVLLYSLCQNMAHKFCLDGVTFSQQMLNILSKVNFVSLPTDLGRLSKVQCSFSWTVSLACDQSWPPPRCHFLPC